MNQWGIPGWLEDKIKKRDKCCVYCGVPLKEYPHTRGNSKDKATWEHIDNDENNKSELNIVRCCASCNSSKGKKRLADWLESPYCQERKIKEKAADIVQESLRTPNK